MRYWVYVLSTSKALPIGKLTKQTDSPLLHAATQAARALRAALSAEIQAARADMFNRTGTFTKGSPRPSAQ